MTRTNKKLIVVLGMHRSGTSCLTSLFYQRQTAWLDFFLPASQGFLMSLLRAVAAFSAVALLSGIFVLG